MKEKHLEIQNSIHSINVYFPKKMHVSANKQHKSINIKNNNSVILERNYLVWFQCNHDIGNNTKEKI